MIRTAGQKVRENRRAGPGPALAPVQPWWAAIVLLLLAILVGCSLAPAAPAAPVVTRSNGVPVAPEFEAFYQEYGGPRVIGLPHARAFVDPDRQRMLQYFQNMQLIIDLDDGEVTAAALGAWAMPAVEKQTIALLQVPAEAVVDEETGFSIQDEFLSFYRRYGGQRVFGRPISAQLNEGGLRVQYFENARLEWRPGQPLEYRVQVGRLGISHYQAEGRYEDPERYKPVSSVGIREALVVTNVRSPILYAGDQQVVFVDVLSLELRQPVEGVRVLVVLGYDGQEVTVELPVSDEDGHTQAPIDLEGADPGQRVVLEIRAFAPDGPLIATASRTFTLWW